jgi:FkbM family methyltransferase
MESTLLTRTIHTILSRSPGLYRILLNILKKGSIEKRLYLSLIRRGFVVIDIGANTGYFTHLFSGLVGRKGMVHAFEPVPEAYQSMIQRLDSFHCTNVVPNPVALGERNRMTSILVPGNDSAQASLVPHHSGSWSGASVQRFKVQQLTLDDYCCILPKIDFIKCDVEGAELLVLKGGASTLKRCLPVLVLEVERRWTKDFGWQPDAIQEYLSKIGYRHFYISKGEGDLSPHHNQHPAFSKIPESTWVCSHKEIDGLA